MGSQTQVDMGGLDLVVNHLRVGATAPGLTGTDIGTSTSFSGDVTITAGGSVKSSVANLIYEARPAVVQQALSGAGAVNITTYNTALTTTGANALTLADSTVIGQVKRIQLVVDGGDGTLTFNGSSTIVFADIGDTVELIWNGTDWIVTALYNMADGTTAPVYTP